MTPLRPPSPPTPLTVDVVLPCLDEAGALPRVLERIPDGWRALVVDNGSTDGSAAIAAGLGATVVHEPRRGFGAACHAGLRAATAELVCF
ncbi:glycosyltransferase, partial [Streptomyces sp. SID10853]|uniref:glycosyltransferase n=1 Tax=Streptomyces sp. SID10853 TaxID=2706028 RepID=UPI001EF2DBD5